MGSHGGKLGSVRIDSSQILASNIPDVMSLSAAIAPTLTLMAHPVGSQYSRQVNAALANLASLTIFTKVANSLQVIYSMVIRASNAGKYQIDINGVGTQFDFFMATNSTIQFNWYPHGYAPITTNGQALVLTNNSGAASDVAISTLWANIATNN